MGDKPRSQREQILDMGRLLRLVLYGLTMMVGTLFMFQYGLASDGQSYALTLGFTTFVLFQFFNVFNARNESGSAFNAGLFDNRMLWLSLVGTLVLQVVAVHWTPASRLFGTSGMVWSDWAVAIGAASTILLIEEARKLAVRAFSNRDRR
jgi:Ca2+-transporting ATPase